MLKYLKHGFFFYRELIRLGFAAFEIAQFSNLDPETVEDV
jgi:hypothetical protein